MYTLFIDTHDEIINVSLINESEVISKEQKSFHEHAVYLVPMIRDIIEENNLSFKDLKNIVCVNGPGSFTGLRIGLTAGKVLAYILGIPIYLISSLEAYLVSNTINKDSLCVIPDSKGFYIRGENVREQYVKDLSNYDNFNIIENKLDVMKVVMCALNKESVNVHLVRANYVKEIEVNK